MELLYVWVKEFKNIREQGFNFSPAWHFRYTPQEGVFEIIDRRDQTLANLFGYDISNITAIVGENGSGKSNLLEFLVRLFDRGTGFWDEPFIAVFKFEQNIKIWHFKDILLHIKGMATGLEIIPVAFKMRDLENGVRGGMRGENEIDNVQFVYYSQYFDGLRRGFGRNRNDNFFDMSNSRFMLKKVNDEKGERDIFLSPNNYYLNDVRRQVKFFGAGGKSLVDFPVPHFLKITVNEDVNLDSLTQVFSRKASSLSSNYGADEIWNFFEGPGFVLKAYRSVLFASLVDASAMSILGENFIEGIKSKIKDYPADGDPLKLLEGWEDGYLAPFKKITHMIQWVSENCQDYIYNHPVDRIFKTRDDALILPTDSPLVKNFFSLLEDLDIHFSYPFNFSWTFQDDPNWDGVLSSGYGHLLNFFARIYNAKIRFLSTHSIFFFIDEGEIGLHPQLQKQYINILVKNIPRIIPRPIGENKSIQIILTSHSPFILSDLPRENVVFLEKNENNTCKVVNGLHDMKQTFGANIHTLLSDAFFLRRHEGLMGTFAKERIDQVIRFYQKNEMIDDMDETASEAFADKIISWVGEPIIHRYLQQLQNSKSQKRMFQEVIELKAEIEQLKNKITE